MVPGGFGPGLGSSLAEKKAGQVVPNALAICAVDLLPDP